MSKNKDITFPAQDCISVFCEYMEVKAEHLGLSNNTLFNDPCGIDNYSTAKDILRCLIRGNECIKLREIWKRESYTVKIEGENARDLPLSSTVLADDDSHILTDSYEILGGKTGTLTPHGAFNISFIAQIPDSEEQLACVVMYAAEKNGLPNNRFKAAKEVLDAALIKYKDRSQDVSGLSVCANSAICCVVPPKCAADEYHAKLDILFEKNAGEKKMPASMTKILTSVICLEFIKDLEEKITVTQEVIDTIPGEFYGGDFKAGDVITVKDAMHAMMLPSSNSAAYILANYVGNKIFTDEE